MFESTDQSRSQENWAIQVSRAYKNYGQISVLRGLDMNVKEGTIYGLLGPSGCGKSTLLNAIVGLSNLDDGYITMNVVRKRDLGFMPQQTALYSEMSTNEILHYYGKVCGLTTEDTDRRIRELDDTIELVDRRRPVSTLSGGQRRRVSLAVALVHCPRILILDEPTSGIDPLLRERIWTYMKELSEKSKVTVIITTHYIEEARQAHSVGLMREGVLLSEDSPENILKATNCDRMETAFLKLSYKQSVESSSTAAWKPAKKVSKSVASPLFKSQNIIDSARLTAELKKNLLFQLGNLKTALFIWFLPAFCILVFNYAFGVFPDELPMGIVNNEVPFKGQNTCVSPLQQFNCSSRQLLSCVLSRRLGQNRMKLIYFRHQDETERLIRSGELKGYIVLPANFTQALAARGTFSYFTPTRFVDASQIEILTDTNVLLKNHVKASLLLGFKKFLHDVYSECGEPGEKVFELPISMKAPIYGSLQFQLREYVLPVLMCVVLFSTPLVYGVVFLLEEKLSGATARSIVSGVTVVEILLGHLVFQFISQFIQAGSMLVVAHVIFGYHIVNVKLILLLYFVETLPGIILSFLVAVIFDDQIPAALACIGLNLVFFMLSGLTWPIEGSHPLVQPFALSLPPTNLARSVQGILYRDWGLLDPPILESLGLLFIWSIVPAIAIYLYLKKSKQNAFQFLS